MPARTAAAVAQASRPTGVEARVVELGARVQRPARGGADEGGRGVGQEQREQFAADQARGAGQRRAAIQGVGAVVVETSGAGAPSGAGVASGGGRP